MSGERTTSFISARLAAGLALLSFVSLVVLLALVAYAPDFREDSNAGAHVLSKSAVGFAGLRVLLEADGVATTIDRGAASQKESSPSLTILTPELGNKSPEIKSLATAGPVLVILPKWLVAPVPLNPGRVMKLETISSGIVADLLKAFSATTRMARAKSTTRPHLTIVAKSFGLLAPAGIAPVDSLQTISGKDWIPLIAARGGAVFAQLRGEDVYVLADPDLVNTHGLHDEFTAATALSIIQSLRPGDAPVSFDVTLNGFRRPPSLLRVTFAPPFLGATLCAILAAMLIGWHAASRFGAPAAPIRAVALGKRALTDNTADLIRMMRREPKMAERYAMATRNYVLGALGAQRGSSPAQAESWLRSMELPAGPIFAQLVAEANQARSRADMLEVASKLFRWRVGILHGR